MIDLGDQVYFAERRIQRNPMAYVVRTSGDPAVLAGAVRQLVARLDPQLPEYDLRPGAAALVACWLPARRASAISPLDAIRAD